MGFKGIRLPVIGVTLVLTLGVLFGIRWFYQDRAFHRPLVEALGAIPAVRNVEVHQDGATLEVKVLLGDALRLETLVDDLWRAVESVESGPRVRLCLSDSRDEALEDVYYDCHFLLQEAVSTGRYSDLPERLAEVATSARVDRARAFVGRDYVFVQLHKDGLSLYEVLPRRPSLTGSDTGHAEDTRMVTTAPWGS
ncbi:MAG: hypothetical protein C4551_01250 [Bacillota bacterium]|nr:MAG: hypothetical protein C4551_01250 [Bacillota bacterium]